MTSPTATGQCYASPTFAVLALLAFGGIHPMLAAQPPAQTPPAPAWLEDANHCRFPTPRAAPKATVTWTGACVDGLGQGDGTLTVRLPGKRDYVYTGPVTKGMPEGTGRLQQMNGILYEGELHLGLPDGHGTATFPNSDRYEGEFYGGKFDGQGTYTFANGARYVGDFVHGVSTRSGTLTLPDGQSFKTDLVAINRPLSPKHTSAAPSLYVLCFNSDQSFASLTPVRESGDWRLDQQAHTRIIVAARYGDARAGHDVGSPSVGCHMLAYQSGPDGYSTARFADYDEDVGTQSREEP